MKHYISNAPVVLAADEYHLHKNQKLRMLVMLYERNNPVFEKWPEDQKIINENTGLKIMIKSIVSKSYQSNWIIEFLKSL